MNISMKEQGKITTRLLFLKTSVFFLFILAVPKAVWSFFVDKFRTRTVELETFEFDPVEGIILWDKKPVVKEQYSLIVEGLVHKPKSFSYKDLKAFPQIVQTSDFHCVEGWSVRGIQWGGIRFSEIVRAVKPKQKAKYVVFHSLGMTPEASKGISHYIECIPLKKLLDPGKKCLLALTLDGKPLSFDRGSPLRVVSPYDLGYKGSKYVSRIVFTADQSQGWWSLAGGYSMEAPVPGKRLKSR